MTEEEAKTRWCPFIRFTDETDGTYGVSNRGDVCDRSHNQEARDLSRCISSACMAWRWQRDAHYANAGAHLTHYSTSKTEGFCGLAGKP